MDKMEASIQAITGRVRLGPDGLNFAIALPTKFELVVNLKTARQSVSLYRRRCYLAPTR